MITYSGVALPRLFDLRSIIGAWIMRLPFVRKDRATRRLRLSNQVIQSSRRSTGAPRSIPCDRAEIKAMLPGDKLAYANRFSTPS